jgi:hypothetical protein
LALSKALGCRLGNVELEVMVSGILPLLGSVV